MLQTELNRIQILEQTLGGLISTGYAALLLDLSEHHAFRLKAKLREYGPASLARGNRGRKPAQVTLSLVDGKVAKPTSTRRDERMAQYKITVDETVMQQLFTLITGWQSWWSRWQIRSWRSR